MKYVIGWSVTTCWETIVEADSKEEAEELFEAGGLENCYIVDELDDIALEYVEPYEG